MSVLESSDRRSFPRFDASIPLDLFISGVKTTEPLHATSVNVSMNGVYCNVSRHIPLFTRTHVRFVNPDQKATPDHIISQCEGIVVRVEPEHEEMNRQEYRVALCFQRLFQQEREALQEMINAHTGESLPASA
jgi:hypothetical protein